MTILLVCYEYNHECVLASCLFGWIPSLVEFLGAEDPHVCSLKARHLCNVVLPKFTSWRNFTQSTSINWQTSPPSISGWWFGTFGLFSPTRLGMMIQSDELHHFSGGWLNHQLENFRISMEFTTWVYHSNAAMPGVFFSISPVPWRGARWKPPGSALAPMANYHQALSRCQDTAVLWGFRWILLVLYTGFQWILGGFYWVFMGFNYLNHEKKTPTISD